MRIAMVFDGLQVGGIERVGVDYAKLLSQMGHQVTIFNLKPSETDIESDIPPTCEIKHYKFSRVMSPEFYSKLSKKTFVLKWGYPFAYGILTIFNQIYKIPCRSRGREYDVAIAFSGHYNDLTFIASNFLKSKKKLCWLHGAGYALISDGFLNLYGKIRNLVVLVDAFQDEVLAVNKQLNLNIQKIYNPTFIAERQINSDKVNQLKKQYGDFLIMVGRISNDKDQLTLIKAIEYIRKKYKFLEKLLLVGDGEKCVELKKYVKSHSLEEQIIFVGNRKDVENYYSAAYLFAHSSPLEGLPTTLIEALYFELPIVATDSLPGVREILGNSEYGMITPVGDYEQMGEEIYRMYQDNKLYNKYKLKSNQKSKEFAPETIMEKLQKILV